MCLSDIILIISIIIILISVSTVTFQSKFWFSKCCAYVNSKSQNIVYRVTYLACHYNFFYLQYKSSNTTEITYITVLICSC